jgi:hypothetical protein
MSRTLTLSVLLLLFLSPPLLFAKPQVYTWTDESGVVHFSSKPTNPEAKQAELPEINRGDVQIVKPKLISCTAHGGIDCQAGADEDGSVICHDGFRGASARYRFTCNSPKLQITGVTPVDELGNFIVTVRNLKSVRAISTALLYTPEPGTEVKLTGPNEVGPYEVVEYTFEPKDADIPTGTVGLEELTVKCANCP